MRRPVVVLITVLAAIGTLLFVRDLPLDSLSRPTAGDRHTAQNTSISVAGAPVRRPGESIHVGSFNVQVFGRTKAGKPHVLDTLANIGRHFDVLAIQEVRTKDQDVIPRLVDYMNAAGRNYDYVVGPQVGPPNTTEQYAFLYDRSTVEVDRNQLYSVQDPDDLLSWEPLVGWFRTIGPPKPQAFTFTLVNVRIDPQKADQELSVLDDVFRAVRDDGRGEDDVIVLGDFFQGAGRLDSLKQVGGMIQATTGIPTNTQSTAQYDNLLFQRQATGEFTGRAGVFDFMRRYNFTMEQAVEVSDHLPVWAEFSVYEGGQPGRTADRGGAVQR